MEATIAIQQQSGKTGANVQSWKSANPRSMLERQLASHKTISRERSELLMWQELCEICGYRPMANPEADLLRIVFVYWHANNYLSLRNATVSPESRVRQATKRAEVVAETVKRVQKKIVQEFLLSLDADMPNGKTLGDCTGSDCRKMGGLLAALGATLKRNQTVRSAFSEEELNRFEIKNRRTKP